MLSLLHISTKNVRGLVKVLKLSLLTEKYHIIPEKIASHDFLIKSMFFKDKRNTYIISLLFFFW